MFAGKTTELIRRLDAARAEGLAVVAVKPRIETRYGEGLRTHGGLRRDSTDARDAAEVGTCARGAAVVGIDEAHFFGAALIQPCRVMIAAGARVIVAGLEFDHRGGDFAPLDTLMSEADEVFTLSCPCAVCGRPAVHSQRLIESDARIVVGGAESYEPRCRECFTPPR